MKSRARPLMAGLIAIYFGASAALAQPVGSECAQSVKIIVSYPPGSPDDVIARILAQKLSEAGGRFHVENMPGAAGAIGTAAAARALPDGCTMVIVNQNLAVQSAIGEKLSYDSLESFTPVALLLAAPETISVNPSVPATSMKELAALVRQIQASIIMPRRALVRRRTWPANGCSNIRSGSTSCMCRSRADLPP